MDKNRHTLSATELSKFEYCPYQWYYERLYGRNDLRKLEKERNEQLGLREFRKENFESGIQYHNEYDFKARFTRVLVTVVIIVAIIVFVLVKAGLMP